jgi:FtsP/CotA-like multicopper oxidase with cupredoxin domain
MKAMLMVEEGAGGTAGGTTATTAMSAEDMDKAMAARTAAFPAKTDGVGAQEMAPKVLADGTKEFDLTASEFDWEIEPGKTVKAWGYNEQVPGPTIRVAVGDKIRIVLTNKLPEYTVLHSHGFVVPNKQDGVPDITQDAIKPGDTFTYEWTVREPMVGMYHSHFDAQVQVPNGLLGAFYAGDMPLPAGVTAPTVSQPMVLNDAGAIGFSLNGKSFPATAPIVAKVGDWVRIDYMNEGLLIHPMHLHGMPQLVFAKDGYPQTPHLEDTVTVAPGERVSVLVHATEPGTWAWHCHILNHAERADGMFGMVTALVVQ